jgi:hypothetical protein
MMRDFPSYPRVPRPRAPQTDKVEKAVVGVGCLAFLIWAAFWITVIVVAAHFIIKYW